MTPPPMAKVVGQCTALQLAAAAEFRPDVLVGLSHGAAVLAWMVAAGRWDGPAVLIVPAFAPCPRPPGAVKRP